ncbi:MAG: hypothetical protein GY856_53525 [bacterium]|nr:hypothetical protein [bacterium]
MGIQDCCIAEKGIQTPFSELPTLLGRIGELDSLRSDVEELRERVKILESPK